MLNPCDYILPSARAYFLRPISNCYGYKAAETGLYSRVDIGRASGKTEVEEDVVAQCAQYLHKVVGRKSHNCSEIGR